MSLYKRGGVWWYKFKFQGIQIRESTGLTNKRAAADAERRRHLELREGRAGVTRAKRVPLFSVTAEAWLKTKSVVLAPRSVLIERLNLKHLNPVFGRRLLSDISADDIAHYQANRLQQGAASKTINLEVGTLRAILRRNRLWGTIQPDVTMLKVEDDVGRALTIEEQQALEEACRKSRSRSLYIAIVLALNTCLRYTELRMLTWIQIDFARRTLRVGKSKSEAGAGRLVPLNNHAYEVLQFWAGSFPNRKPEHYVFPSEKYGTGGAHHTDPAKPLGDWKEAWEAAKQRAGRVLACAPEDEDANPLRCRFHDLRHTGCTRLLEAGVPFSVVAVIMGWSASTAVRMAKRYGHISQAARIEAMNSLDVRAKIEAEGAQKGAQSEDGKDVLVN